MKKGAFIFFFLGISLSCLAAFDLTPPDWRGEPRTTYQEWNFSTPSLSPLPDEYEGPFDPLAATVQPVSGPWYRWFGWHQGVFPLSGHMYFPILNFEELSEEKVIQIQVTWFQKKCGYRPLIEAAPVFQEDLDGGSSADWIRAALVGEKKLRFGWRHSTYEIILRPNPPQEIIHITGAIYVDDVIIDTLCMPEPTTLILLGLGGVVLMLRSRRKLHRA